MAKADVKQAYRNVLVHPDDRGLAGHAVARAVAGGWLPTFCGLPTVHSGSRPTVVGDAQERSDLDQALQRRLNHIMRRGQRRV